MHSPLSALTWDIWRRNRKSVWLVLGIFSFGWLAKLLMPEAVIETGGSLMKAVNITLGFIGVLIVFGISSYTEFNPQKESVGFPYRLFVLPLTTLRLVALPMSLGIAAVELAFLVWNRIAFLHDDWKSFALSAVLLGSYMVFYQTILWTLSGLRSLRMVVLGLLAMILIVLGFLTTFPDPLASVNTLIAVVSSFAFMSFLVAWRCVTRQRYGGETIRLRHSASTQWMIDALPRRNKPFRSAVDAQFWFEWRRSGMLLPLLVGALLLGIIGPLSWEMRNDAASTLRILAATLAMPMLLAAPVGKGFSKPDFWSTDLSFPAFQAVRPMATGEMVIVKMKVAARSVAMSWALVLGFISLWLLLWANIASLVLMERTISKIYGESTMLQFVVVALSIVAGMLLTWRFLVGGLWIGLSGNRRLFVASAVPYCLSPIIFFALYALLLTNDAVIVWIHTNPDRLLLWLTWIASLALVAKLAIAGFAWSKMTPQRVRQYWLIWCGSTIGMLALAVLLWADLQRVLPSDVSRLQFILILVSLLFVPLARTGMAQLSLAKNGNSGFVVGEIR